MKIHVFQQSNHIFFNKTICMTYSTDEIVKDHFVEHVFLEKNAESPNKLS